MAQSLTRVLNKLEQLPLEAIGGHLEGTLAGAERLVNGTDLRQTLANLEAAARALTGILAVAEERIGPLLETVARVGDDGRALFASTERAVRRAESTLRVIEASVADDGPIGGELLVTLKELSAAARSIRLMAEYLERHPEAMIQGKSRY
jgi:paraquat-inducible protein B